ncbi:MAG TPA: pyridoxamine 5'-phosphate oxidase family protein, partial [Aldersonia sp.]
MTTFPAASAPILYGSRSSGADLLDWSWACDRLTTATTYWIATVRPDGSPHCRPVWGIWLDEAVWFSTGSLARRNLVHNDAITVHLDDGDAALIVEGRATRVSDRVALEEMCTVYGPKYDWPMHPTHPETEDAGIGDDHGADGPVFAVRPATVFAWTSGMGTPTRWRFPRH